ncbi:MAG: glycosyltransferase family 4 protein [Pseudomonadota bacterium]
MNIGYLLNTYPVTSGTFIRREIEALERRGVAVKRYAIRRWAEALVDPLDIAEQEKVTYLLSGQTKALAQALPKEIMIKPAGVGKALPAWGKIAKTTPGLLRPAAYLAEAAALRHQTEKDGIRHLHVHFGTNAAAVAMLCRLMGGPSYSFTAHGPDEFTNPEALRFDLKVQHAAFAVAISHYARMQLIRWGGIAHRDKIRVARCGLYLPDFQPVSDSCHTKTFICVGRLCPQKGQALIPEAIAPLVAEHPSLKILLVGDGESRPEIEAEIARLGLEKHIELLGWMENIKVRELISECRGLLLPSFAEGLPIVIMEAMALKRPAISTYIAGIPELLDRDCGWIVPPSSVEDLRAALRDALDASPRRLVDMGQEARRRIEARHDVDGLAATLEGLFEKALNAQE